MIIRGGGAAGGVGLAGAGLCICATLLGATGAALVGVAAGGTTGAGVTTRGGTAIAGGAALALVVDGAAGGGVTGGFGGMTTTEGGRYVAATDAGVTILGAGGVEAGVSATGGGTALGATGAGGTSVFVVSTGRAATGGFAGGRTGAGASVVPFCCVIARNTSPGREICDRSILVLISSSPWLREDDLVAFDDASERPRRCFRTRSASCSSSELECVFFSVTPTVVRTSRISLLLTSNSRARSLIRILLIRRRFLFLFR